MTVLQVLQFLTEQNDVLKSNPFLRLEIENGPLGQEVLMLEWAEEGNTLQAKFPWAHNGLLVDTKGALVDCEEVTRLRGLLQLAYDELTGERTEGSWEDTVAQLRKELGSPR